MKPSSLLGLGTDGPQTREPARPLPDLTPDAHGALSQEQMRALTRVVAENFRANDQHQRDYTHIERAVQKKLDGKGQVKSTEVRTYEVMAIYGEQFERLIEKDDKPRLAGFFLLPWPHLVPKAGRPAVLLRNAPGAA